MKIVTKYLKEALSPQYRYKIIDTISTELSNLKGKFVVAFSGMSGALIAPAIADNLGYPAILIRKPTDATNSHSQHTWEGSKYIKNYVIVDDFIQSGETVNRVKIEMSKRNPNGKLLAIATYNQYESEGKIYANKFQCPFFAMNCYYGKGKWCYPNENT